jgi:hypothetical protein
MKNVLFAGLIVLGLYSQTACAADPDVSQIESVRWLVGRWHSPPGERVTCEEHWSAPAGGAMIGMFRLISGEQPGLYELLLLEQETDGVWMRLRHFRPQMVAQEQEPLKLKLTTATPDRLVFENSNGNRPKRVTYTVAGDELTAVVETERDGKPTAFSLKLQRAK